VNTKETRKQDERKRQGKGGKNYKVWIKINGRLEEREEEMKEWMYGVNMKEMRKQDERKRQGKGGKK